MLLLEREERYFLASQGDFNGREFAIEPILVSLAKVLFQNVSPPRFLSSAFWDFLSHSTLEWRASVLFRQPHLSTKSNPRLIELWCSFRCTSSVQDIQNVMVDDALSEPFRNLSSSNR